MMLGKIGVPGRRYVAVVASMATFGLAGALPAILENGPGAALADQANVTLTRVSNDVGVDAGEGWVVTDPRNGDIVLDWLATTDATQQTGGDANATPANMLRGYCGTGTSTDGGKTFSTKELQWAVATNSVDAAAIGPVPGPHTSNRNFPICGDPVLGIDLKDGAVVAAGAQIASPQLEQAETSNNDGYSWSNPTEAFGVDQTVAGAVGNAGTAKTVPIGPGRAWMSFDPNTGAISINSQEDGGVEGRYLVVTHDDGKTWSTPRPLDTDVQDNTAGAQGAAFGTIGVAYIINEGSAAWTASNAATGAVGCPGTATTCTVFETTKDDGVTWTRHFLPIQGTPTGFPSSYVAADPTSPGHFAVLLGLGNGYQIWTTTDSGSSWTEIHTVSPEATGDSLIKPAIAFSPTGALGVVWRQVYPNTSYDIFALVSKDGGSLWSDPVKLTVDGPAPAWNQMSDDCACNVDMDASGLSTVWGDGHTGSRQLWFARLDYTTLPMNNG